MSDGGPHHEHARPARRPHSSRATGLALGLACSVLGLWPILRGATPRWPFLAVGVALGVAALVRPRWLGPLARAWSRVTGVIERIVGALVLAIAFFVLMTPVALASRLFGRDPLGLRKRPGARSYWLRRQQTRTPAESMKVRF